VFHGAARLPRQPDSSGKRKPAITQPTGKPRHYFAYLIK